MEGQSPGAHPREVRAGPTDGRGPGPRHRAEALLPGVTAAAVLAVVATGFGHVVPAVGAPVCAVLGGIAVTFVRPPAARSGPGLDFAARTVLKASVVVLGTGLSFHEVLSVGSASLPVLVGTLVVALLGAIVIGRALGVSRDLRTLIGVGTAICGASAIAATDGVIGASDSDVSYAITTIFTFNVAAVLSFPTIGRALGLPPMHSASGREPPSTTSRRSSPRPRSSGTVRRPTPWWSS